MSTKRSRTGKSPQKTFVRDEDALLKEVLRREGGLVRKRMPKDGACLFRSVSELIHGTQEKHPEVRSRCVRTLLQYSEEFIPFLEDHTSIEQYSRIMSQPGTWGGHLELAALSKAYKVNFKVFTPQKNIFLVDNGFPRTLLLSFLYGNHYDVLYEPHEWEIISIFQSLVYSVVDQAFGSKGSDSLRAWVKEEGKKPKYRNVGMEVWQKSVRKKPSTENKRSIENRSPLKTPLSQVNDKSPLRKPNLLVERKESHSPSGNKKVSNLPKISPVKLKVPTVGRNDTKLNNNDETTLWNGDMNDETSFPSLSSQSKVKATKPSGVWMTKKNIEEEKEKEEKKKKEEEDSLCGIPLQVWGSMSEDFVLPILRQSVPQLKVAEKKTVLFKSATKEKEKKKEQTEDSGEEKKEEKLEEKEKLDDVDDFPSFEPSVSVMYPGISYYPTSPTGFPLAVPRYNTRIPPMVYSNPTWYPPVYPPS